MSQEKKMIVAIDMVPPPPPAIIRVSDAQKPGLVISGKRVVFAHPANAAGKPPLSPSAGASRAPVSLQSCTLIAPIPDKAGTRNIRKAAQSVDRGGSVFNANAIIEMRLRVLVGTELGTLANVRTAQDAAPLLSKAAASINSANIVAYGKTTDQLFALASQQGYFGSPAHVAWSEAAEARTGGRVPANWWRTNDPFGGTSGNGPNILPGGRYPGSVAKIAMAHDTDWTLGRLFNAGPLNALFTATGKPSDIGSYGLVPFHSVNRGYSALYTNPFGHPDWVIRFVDQCTGNSL
jgi:hypothetical protein